MSPTPCGPRTAPAMISPTSATPPRRRAISDATLAAMKMTAIWKRRVFASAPRATFRSAFRRDVRPVEQIHEVDDGNRGTRGVQSGGDLHLTTGIRGDEQLRAAAHDVADLALEERRGQLGLRDVVRARAATAPARFRQRHKLEPGDGLQKSARLLAHALAVQQVAGIVVRHARLQWAGRRGEPDPAEVFARVFLALAERAPAIRPRRVVFQQPAVLPHRGAAAGCVDDERKSVVEG